MEQVTLARLNDASKDAFVRTLGGVFEASPWVAERAYDARPFASVSALYAAMAEEVAVAGEEAQLALIRAHPDLAGKAARAGSLTAASTREQAGAGLGDLTDEEFSRFQALNGAYRETFGFPFIVAVKGRDKGSILAAFEARLEHDRETERIAALAQVYKIARFRLDDLLGG